MTALSWDQSIRSFIAQLASTSPAPGGGSVAALAASLGTAITVMVGNFTQDERFVHVQPQIDEVMERMQLLCAECEDLFASDIISFETYLAALKLPHHTEEEKAFRKQAVQLGAINAIDVPIRLMEVCKTGMVYASSIAEVSNCHVASDLGIGVILLEAAAQSALLTIDINLPALHDLELKQQYFDKAEALRIEIAALKSNTLTTVRNRMTQL
ncbi:MAG: cyclodeaminase/cyclohydrolase family protein [Candidatus Pristimantibacillus sp.]